MCDVKAHIWYTQHSFIFICHVKLNKIFDLHSVFVIFLPHFDNIYFLLIWTLYIWSCRSLLSDRGLTYKDSGVDITAGNKLVETIKPLAKATSRPGNFIFVCTCYTQMKNEIWLIGILNSKPNWGLLPRLPSGCNAELGGFAGLFDLKAAGFVDPILVSGTDGVGTKLKVFGFF